MKKLVVLVALITSTLVAFPKQSVAYPKDFCDSYMEVMDACSEFSKNAPCYLAGDFLKNFLLSKGIPLNTAEVVKDACTQVCQNPTAYRLIRGELYKKCLIGR